MKTKFVAAFVCLAVVGSVLAGSAAAAPPGGQPELSGASQVLLDRFEQVARLIESLRVPSGGVTELLAKLDASRNAAIRGNGKTSTNLLDALAGDLEARGVATQVVDEVRVLRSMVVFEMLVGPIPDAAHLALPRPFQLWTLDVFFADLLVEAPGDAALACTSQIFPLANLVPGNRQDPQDEKQIEEQAKKGLKALAKTLLEEVWTWITGGRGAPKPIGGGGEDPGQPTGQTGGGGGAGGGKKGGPKVKPGCDVDTSGLTSKLLAGETITLDDVKDAVDGVSVDLSYTWVKEDFTATLKGSIDLTNPFGDRSWKAELELQVTGTGSGGRGWSGSLGGSFDSEGTWGVQGGFELRF